MRNTGNLPDMGHIPDSATAEVSQITLKDPPGHIWGLPVIVPTCPKKLFALVVDIVTDTLHASSSDLITRNTLVMMKLNWINSIPRQWIEITTQSLESWKARDEQSPFLSDIRRGYARVTPVALSRVGVPEIAALTLDEYPMEGLGLYDDLETCEQYTGYVWSNWTTKEAQPVHIDATLQAMIDQSSGKDAASTDNKPSHSSAQSTSNASAWFKGSYASTFPAAAPYPDTVEDVTMESSADKRSRESPDSTLKPDGKSLKTSGTKCTISH